MLTVCVNTLYCLLLIHINISICNLMAIRIEIIIVYRSMDIALFIDVLYIMCFVYKKKITAVIFVGVCCCQ